MSDLQDKGKIAHVLPLPLIVENPSDEKTLEKCYKAMRGAP